MAMTQTILQRISARLERGAWELGSLAVFLVGAGMRWYGLSRFPFEQDELYTLQESRELFATTLLPGIHARPLYYLLHHLLTPVLPAGEFGARIPAFLFGLAGLVVTWLLGRYVAGPRGGFLALAICAFSPWHIFVSGEARYWSLIYLISVTTLLLMIAGRRANQWHAYLPAMGLLVAGTLTHPTFIFPFIGIAATALLAVEDGRIMFKWPSRTEALGMWIPAGVIILGYIVSLKVAGRGSTLSNWSGRGWSATLRLLPAMIQLATPAVVAAAVVAVAQSILWGTNRAKEFGLIAIAGMISGTALLLLASTRTDVYADYGVSMLPLGIAAIAFIATEGGAWSGRITGGFAAVLIAAMLPASISQLSDGMRFDYRPAFSAIESGPRPMNSVLAWPLVIQRHYAPALAAGEFLRVTSQLDSLQSTGQPFWVVASENRSGLVGDSSGEVESWLDEHCRRRLTTEHTRLDYRLYRVVLHECGFP